jgi:FKBP-type peptidyl-prolyl cis-trans isomerase SlpA
MKIVERNSQVDLHFNIKLLDGSVADSTRMNAQPATLQLGSGQASSAFEQQLIGLREKEKKDFILTADDTVGQANPNNYITINKNNIPIDLAVELGTILAFPQQNGQELPGIVTAIAGDTVEINFNHPLCGQDLKFEVEIIKIYE